MNLYELELSPAAKRDLKKLPMEIQKEIVFHHLPVIKENPYKTGKPLSGTLCHERSYHFGRRPEYRIVYFVENRLITVTLIGTREGIYKKATRRQPR